MASQPQPKISGLTLSELVNSLKSAVQNAGEAILSGEDKLWKEIELWKGRCYYIFSEKLRLEKECGELKDSASRSKEELRKTKEALLSRENELEIKNKDIVMLEEKLRIQVSEKLRFEKECRELKESASYLKADFSNRLVENQVEKKQIYELKRKISRLECDKLRAKSDENVYKKTNKVLAERVLCLEKDLITLTNISGKRKASENVVKVKSEELWKTNTSDDDDDLPLTVRMRRIR